MNVLFRSGIILVLLSILSACASNKLLRPDVTACDAAAAPENCERHALLVRSHTDGGENFRLGIVEIDDQGQVRDRRQLDAVLNDFRRISGTHDVLLVAFVHGWHHNARYDDDNLAHFKGLLNKLAAAEARGSGRKVLGLYLGWRGESLEVPGLRYLTFWERKDTATKVGSNGVTEVFLKLEEIANVKSGQGASVEPADRSRLVLLGHSFGGAVVFNALGQILADRFIDSRAGKTYTDTVKGFGDLVVLLNPAFEALRYASLYDLARERCSYFSDQLPRLAILTSEADWATGIAFPAGRFFSTLFETHDTVKREYCPGTPWAQTLHLAEGKADRSAVGHFDPFLTHDLHAVSQYQVTAEAPRSFEDLSRHWKFKKSGDSLALGPVQLVHRGSTHPQNPYLNVRVDKALIPDHNQIWDDRIIGFVRDLIILSTSPQFAPQSR